jgi:hypothetical protein
MKQILILLPFFVLTAISADLFYQLKQETGLEQKECLVVVYFESATCIKCFLEPNYYIDYIKEKCGTNRIKVIGLLRCDRDIEMKVFKKQIKWTHQLYRDNGNARKELGATSDAILSVFSSDGKKSLHIRSGNNNDNVESIVDFINND